MATDPRRFDEIEKVVRDNGRQLDDVESTIKSRLAAHTHIATAGYFTSSTRPTTVVAGELIHESDTHNNLVSNGSVPASGSWEHMSIPVVSATSSILVPWTGQVIFNTTDNMLYRYDGSAWVGFLAVGGTTATTRHEARYEQTTLQGVANATETKVKFDTAVTTCDDVTASGTGNTDFNLVRAGLWQVSVGVRYVAGTTGERYLALSTGTVIGTFANRFAGQSTNNVSTAAISLAMSTEIRVAANTSVMAPTYQSNGGTLNTDVGFGHSNHIALTWLRP